MVLEDKVALLKSGCSELMFIKANYSYDKDRDVLTLGEDVSYTRESFIKGLKYELKKNFMIKINKYF